MPRGVASARAGNLAEAEVFAVAADPLASGQGGQQQVEGFREAGGVAVQAGAEDLQVDPGAAAGHAEVEPAAGDHVQQGCFLGEGDRVAVGQDRRGGTHPQPTGAAKQERGQRHRGRADPVADEVVFGQPHPVEPGGLRRASVGHRAAQRRRLVGARELPGEQEQVHLHTRARRTSAWNGLVGGARPAGQAGGRSGGGGGGGGVSSHAVRVTG